MDKFRLQNEDVGEGGLMNWSEKWEPIVGKMGKTILSEMWEHSNCRRIGKKYFVGKLGLSILSEIRA